MNKVREGTPRPSCEKCGQRNLYLDAEHGDFGKDRTTYVLVCLNCGRRQGAKTLPHRGYRNRIYYRVRGISSDTLDEVKRGRSQFVWGAS